MGAERFELLLRDESTGQELKREWSKPELVKSIAWLKRINARGSEIFIRPAGPHGLVLLDRLKAENLAAMRDKGFEPAVVIESYLGEYQAWLGLSALPVAEQVRQLAAEKIVETFGGVPSDSAANRFGLLAGFTTHDRKHERTTIKRFVLAHETGETISSNGENLLTHIESALRAIAIERNRGRTKVQQEQRNQGRSR